MTKTNKLKLCAAGLFLFVVATNLIFSSSRISTRSFVVGKSVQGYIDELQLRKFRKSGNSWVKNGIGVQITFESFGHLGNEADKQLVKTVYFVPKYQKFLNWEHSMKSVSILHEDIRSAFEESSRQGQ
jgi:hypothetical protein